MKVKTAEAINLQLDWGLGLALDLNPELSQPSSYDGSICVMALPLPNGFPRNHKFALSYTDTSVCMKNIASYKIDIHHQFYSSPKFSILASWGDEGDYGYTCEYGSTVEEAITRLVISIHLGGEFECPNHLDIPCCYNTRSN